MTPQEIQERNKEIAIMIGAKPCKDWQGEDGFEHPSWYHLQWSNRFQDNLELHSYRYSELKFHSDWNWLMEVVVFAKSELNKKEANKDADNWGWYLWSLSKALTSANKEDVFIAISDFAKKFNNKEL